MIVTATALALSFGRLLILMFISLFDFIVWSCNIRTKNYFSIWIMLMLGCRRDAAVLVAASLHTYY